MAAKKPKIVMTIVLERANPFESNTAWFRNEIVRSYQHFDESITDIPEDLRAASAEVTTSVNSVEELDFLIFILAKLRENFKQR